MQDVFTWGISDGRLSAAFIYLFFLLYLHAEKVFREHKERYYYKNVGVT